MYVMHFILYIHEECLEGIGFVKNVIRRLCPMIEVLVARDELLTFLDKKASCNKCNQFERCDGDCKKVMRRGLKREKVKISFILVDNIREKW